MPGLLVEVAASGIWRTVGVEPGVLGGVGGH